MTTGSGAVVHGLVAAGVVVVVFVGYYYFAKRQLLRVARVLATRPSRWGAGRSVLEKAALYEIALVVLSHLLFVAVLLALLASFGVTVPGLAVGTSTIALLPLGAGLGVAQMATSIFCCQVIIGGVGLRSVRAERPAAAAGAGSRTMVLSPQAWTDYSRAGWMRHHLVAGRAVARSVSVPLTTLQVACEEVVFRGVFPIALAAGFSGGWPGASNASALGPAPLAWGLAVSSVLFVVMQAFFMPGWRSAMFPVVGSLLMSITHSYLYLTVGELWPLVLAHAVSFFAAAKE